MSEVVDHQRPHYPASNERTEGLGYRKEDGLFEEFVPLENNGFIWCSSSDGELLAITHQLSFKGIIFTWLT